SAERGDLMRRLITTAAVAALAIVGLAAPSWAHDGWHAVEPWTPIETIDGEQNDARESQITGPFSASLIWHEGWTSGHGGTSLETANLGLEVQPGEVITVHYKLAEGADPAG